MTTAPAATHVLLVDDAEGVETTGERDALVDLGCDLLQGYHFAKPGRGFPDAAP